MLMKMDWRILVLEILCDIGIYVPNTDEVHGYLYEVGILCI